MPDASNASLPHSYPVIAFTPPTPSTTRATKCNVSGNAGRLQEGKPVISYVSNKSVVIRNLDTSTPLVPTTGSNLPVLVYRGHNVNATAIQISVAGTYGASGDERGKLRVWALDHEEHLCKFDGPVLSGPILDIDWDGESKRIAIAGERSDTGSDAARVVHWDTGVSIGQLGQHVKGRVSSISFKPQRPMRIVTAGKEDYKLCFNSGPPFQKVTVTDGIPCETGHEAKGSGINAVRYNHTGTLVASTGGDKAICIYDGKTLALKTKLDAVHKLTIFAIEWSDDDKHLITCSSDGKVKLLDINEDGTQLSITKEWDVPLAQLGGAAYEKVPVGGQQLGCCFVNGKTPVSVSLNGQLSILPMVDGEQIEIKTGHSAPIAGLAIDTKNGVFYSGDTDGILCQWKLETAQPMKRIAPVDNNDLMYVVHSGAISGLTTLPDGRLLSVGWDDKLYVTDTKGKVGSPTALPAQPSFTCTGTNLVVIVTVQGIVLVQDGKVAGEMFKTSYTANTACVSKDDKLVFVGGEDCKIYIYEVSGTTLKEKHIIDDGHRKSIHSMALSNDGTKLASADMQDICVFDVKDGYKPLIGRGRWCFHTQRITCLTWSPNDKVLASGGADENIYLWSLEKKMKRKQYQYAHRGGLTGLSFVPSGGGYKLLSTGMDACVLLWDVAEEVKTLFGV